MPCASRPKSSFSFHAFVVGMFAFQIVPGLVFALLATCAAAQQPLKPTPPAPPPPPAVDQQQFLAYWTTETGWTSELQLRNNGPQDLVVTPGLRLADGSETQLAAVTIKPQEVQSLDLGSAITSATPQLIGTFGSIALHYHSPSAASLYAAMMVRETGHPVAFHIDGMGEWQDLQAGGREGIWWLPNSTASDYLILTNYGKRVASLNLSLYDASGKQAPQPIALAPGQTARYSVRKLLASAGLSGSYGGIKVSTTAHAGSLDTLHFLFDETVGFSALLKMFDYDPNAKIAERDYAGTSVWTLHAPMLALSTPDPALALPTGTALHPQLFIRNTTAKPLDATLRFRWRASSSTGSAPGPVLHLAPYETRLVDVAALQSSGALPQQANWAAVTLTTTGLPDEIVAVAASYDDTLKFGAQTPFSDQLAHKWEGSMWEFDAYHDSIITAGNGGSKPTQAAFTIFYNQGTQKYEMQQTLQPDEQMWVDVGQLIREQVPDKNGNTLPANLTFGSYEIVDLTNKGVGTLFEGKVIYDKTYGHAAYGCGFCCGYSGPFVGFNPLPVPISIPPIDQPVYGRDMCNYGYLDDVSDDFYFNWISADTSIVTVDSYGNHTGVAVGSTSSYSSGFLVQKQLPHTLPAHEVLPQRQRQRRRGSSHDRGPSYRPRSGHTPKQQWRQRHSCGHLEWSKRECEHRRCDRRPRNLHLQSATRESCAGPVHGGNGAMARCE